MAQNPANSNGIAPRGAYATMELAQNCLIGLWLDTPFTRLTPRRSEECSGLDLTRQPQLLLGAD